VRVPRVKLSDGAVRLVEPPWAGQLSGFTLLFEALVLSLCREMLLFPRLFHQQIARLFRTT